MVKKAYIKTIEILLVIIISTIFIFAIIPKQETLRRDDLKDILFILGENPYFRSFASENTGCFDSETMIVSDLIEPYLPQSFNYILCIDSLPDTLPNKDVFAESFFFSGNHTEVQKKVLRLYYWAKD
jgi:hypothetical protein